MAQFEVKITETLTREVVVDAEDMEEAYLKVSDGWVDEKYVLTLADFEDVSFNVAPIGYKDLETCE